jgi:hypothetical protein
MHPPAPRSPWLLYVASLAIGLAVIATSLGLIAQASTGLTQRTEREKSFVDLQIESAREIRAALAKPITVPPLPPITAKPLRDVRSVAAESSKSRMRAPIASTARGMNAMAMQTPDNQAAFYPTEDRFRPQ